ncbi:MAG TPA: SRPBCC family protein [Balneolaceae bacterium]
METQNTSKITVETTIDAPIEKVWNLWSMPEHITKWNNASDDWHSPWAENDLRTGGKFVSRMEARDGSVGFDFSGIYDDVKKHKFIAYTMEDGRKVEIRFSEDGNTTRVTEIFDPEDTNSWEVQQSGWQAILDNFKKYTETKSGTGLQKIHFSVEINAPKEKVWDTMLNDETYRKWTSAFTEGSYFEGSWDRGSKILFLDPDKNGMVAKIAENKPHEFISIEHIGFIAGGVEDTESEGAKAFAGAHENYMLSETDGKTEVSVEMDTSEEYKEMFEGMWPKALAKLKELAES